MRLCLEGAGVRIDGRWLVRDVSLAIRPGQVGAIVGPNGSGKSTVLRLLAGMWKPTEGKASADGVSLQRMPRRAVARSIAFVPQDTHIGFAFTVREIVTMGRHPHVGRFGSLRAGDAEAVAAALERADVAHLADRLATELSGGERQRVLLARSLATEADALLLDEPTSNLDLDHSLDTYRLLKALAAEGKAVALTLHDLNAVARWADSVALIHQGRLRAKGPAADVLSDNHLERVFGVRAERLRTAGGEPALVFHRGNGSTSRRRGG